ncbi:MAG TPA: thiol peroxidase [Syntrophorhabdales bacterium]|nr:thiol peroxidase [Syntrophorhabdales bacterium]
MERTGVVTFAGNPLTLLGNPVSVGDKAPAFTLVDRDLKEVALSDFAGKVKLISVTPSLDTPVCDLQARRFNDEAQALSDAVVVLNVSVDLPFAIARYCADAGLDRVKALSDHREAAFGMSYGVLIKGLRLLARSIFVIDKANVIRYQEIVPEVTHHPDYDRALAEAKKLVS